MKKTLFFIFSILLILISIDRISGTFLFQLNDYVKCGNNVGGKLNYFLAKKDKTEILLLGDSRTEYGIIPDSLGGNAFNLAHHGKLLDFHSCVLEILRSKNKLPKKIILAVDPYQFLTSAEYPNFNSAFTLRQYYDSQPLVKKYITDVEDQYIALKWSSYLYRYNSAIPTLLINVYKTKKGISIKNKGFDYIEKNENDSIKVNFAVKEKTARISNYSNDITVSKIEILKTILIECSKNKIDLVLIVAPTKYCVKDKYRIGMNSIKKIANKYKCPIIDFNNNNALSNINLWSDSEHLNIDGAKVFSNNLKEELLKLNFLTI